MFIIYFALCVLAGIFFIVRRTAWEWRRRRRWEERSRTNIIGVRMEVP